MIRAKVWCSNPCQLYFSWNQFIGVSYTVQYKCWTLSLKVIVNYGIFLLHKPDRRKCNNNTLQYLLDANDLSTLYTMCRTTKGIMMKQTTISAIWVRIRKTVSENLDACQLQG